MAANSPRQRSSRTWLCRLLLLTVMLNITLAQDEPECSKTKPCEKGCCSSFGFCGLGSDYCSQDICVNNCGRKAECDPGGFGDAFVERKTCPLNVCCSKYGFCGTTEEFCGKDQVRRPKCDVDISKGFGRVVGYYESWSKNRPCNRFYPEQIPKGVYTHINFAFAGVDPESFELVPSSKSDADLYQRLAALKEKDSQLKILIAVGGWTFNDPGPTATVFSDIARSDSAQKKFINSVLSFLQTYDLDGLDLDWEYPVADDRSGRDEDFTNFPQFMENLKKALKDYELSITLPASYWYLQHFDIKKLAPHVDFFNMMTYDFHGVWDKPNEWVGPYLNSHTNLTEIKSGLDLLWRNSISSDKVTLGLAFYGRGFAATSPNCLDPGCTYESGTSAQACSGEIGVLLNSEIDDLVKKNGLKPTLDKDAAVKIITWDDNNWATYDDKDTLKTKADFARSQCLGGVMVWAISHDTPDANYSKALGEVAPRKYFPFTALAQEDSGWSYDENYKKQCRWTNCDENCPNNWFRMMRTDSKARKDEFMVDGAGCDGRGAHKLCCPPDVKPPECDACPSGMTEIGSNNEYCHDAGGARSYGGVKKYQAACCTTDVQSMELYGQCSWTEYPLCDRGVCNDDTVAYSSTGSGDATCYGWWWGSAYIKDDDDKMKYCCDQDENKKWSSCDWHSDLSSSSSSFPSDFCHANCPEGDVRVAMDHSGCSGSSAKARCCKPDYKTITKRMSNSDDIYWDGMLDQFLDDPVCTSSNIFNWDPIGVSSPSLESKRATTDPQLRWEQQAATIALVRVLFWGSPRPATIDLWNSRIRISIFNSLSYESVVDYMRNAGRELFTMLGYTQGPEYFVCNLAQMNEAVDDGGDDGNGSATTKCVCVRNDCCYEDDDVCIGSSASGLSKRGEAKSYDWEVTNPATGQLENLKWDAPRYPSPSDLDPVRDVAKLSEAYMYDPNCANWVPVVVSIINPAGGIFSGFQNDHSVERQMFRLWGDDALNGYLRAATTTYFYYNGQPTSIPFNFFGTTLQQVNSPAGTFQQRIMAELGSMNNRDVMTLVVGDMNNKKEHLWVTKEAPAGVKTMEDWVYGNTKKAAQPLRAKEEIRRYLIVYAWHNVQNVNGRYKTVINNIRRIIREAERLHLQNFGVSVPALAHFDAWIKSHFALMRQRVKDWAIEWLENLEEEPTIRNSAVDLAQVNNMKLTAQNLPAIDQTGFYPVLP